MFTRFIRTQDDTSALVLRLMLAIVFFPHGAQKVLGWFGGHGLEGTINYFTQSMGLPLVLAVLVIAAEFLGSIGLFFGFLTRLAALGIGCVMVGAISMVHLQHGFFMNWQGNQAGEGIEYHLLAIAIAVALMIKGGGKWSLDGMISRNL
ncbi:MAG TPA: DoxX family protein [Desulfuromonadales bacterium]|nr:DoxX family protein [Desulfuromonadales bacterium]